METASGLAYLEDHRYRNPSTGNLANNLAILPLLFCRHSISTFIPLPFFFFFCSRRLTRRLVSATFIVNNPLERVGRGITTRFCSSFFFSYRSKHHTRSPRIRVDKFYDFTSERDCVSALLHRRCCAFGPVRRWNAVCRWWDLNYVYPTTRAPRVKVARRPRNPVTSWEKQFWNACPLWKASHCPANSSLPVSRGREDFLSRNVLFVATKIFNLVAGKVQVSFLLH